MSTVTGTFTQPTASASSIALSAIRAEAMDLIDEPLNSDSGKFSLAWWARRINRAKDVLAQETGFYTGMHSISVLANAQSAPLPDTLCWGVLGVQWDDDPLKPLPDSSSTPIWQYEASPTTGTPRYYAIVPPNVYLSEIPAANGTVRMFGGILPSDLSADSDTVTGLPAQFLWVMANGAAAVAEGIDLYAQPQSGRGSIYSQAFWRGVGIINAYMDDIDKRRQGCIQLLSPHRADVTARTYDPEEDWEQINA